MHVTNLEGLVNAIKNKESEIVLDEKVYKKAKGIKEIKGKTWKTLTPIIAAMIPTIIAVGIPDPGEPVEVAALAAEIATCLILIGAVIWDIIGFIKYGNGKKELESLRNDYTLTELLNHTAVLRYIYEKSIDEIGMPKVVYIEKARNYVDYNGIGHISEKSLCDWMKINDIDSHLVTDRMTGNILIQHPFLPKAYIDLKTTEVQIFNQKMMCISEIVQNLGAKEINGHAIFRSEEKRTIRGDGQIDYKTVKASASVNSKKQKNYESQYKISNKFKGICSEESYNEALKKAENYGLINNSDVKNLINERSPRQINSLTNWNITIDLSNELNNSLDIAFHLIISGVKLKSKIQTALESCKKITLDLKIDF